MEKNHDQKMFTTVVKILSELIGTLRQLDKG
jgi:hypothetical protein